MVETVRTLVVAFVLSGTIGQATVASGANVLANPGFEAGTAVWSQSSAGGLPIINEGAAYARSGSWFAWLGGYDSAVDTIYQEVTIPAGGSSSLSFWYQVATQEAPGSIATYDTLTVSINSATSGALLSTLGTLSNVDWTVNWTQSIAYDVSAFAGQTVRLVITARADASQITSFYLDDLTLSSSGVAENYTALWWNPAESGWGLNLNHQGDIAFGTLFTYDASGNPLWLVMSNGAQSGSGFSGPLYRTTGSAFNANPFVPLNGSNVTQVGTMSLAFSGDLGTLTYSVNGITVTKAIQKQVFGSRAANCTATSGDRSSLTNYQDLWWNPNESGWGINLTHQDNIIFGTLFTYNASGQGIWWVLASGQRQPDGSYFGTLYQTTGSAFNANPFIPNTSANVTAVGTMRLTFSSGTTGMLAYTVNGIGVVKSIVRQEFSTTMPACS